MGAEGSKTRLDLAKHSRSCPDQELNAATATLLGGQLLSRYLAASFSLQEAEGYEELTGYTTRLDHSAFFSMTNLS